MQADTLREKFLDFFESKKHKIIASDSLIPKDDPTVLFTPAGMNQFKKEFLGLDSGFKRAATAQRCLRTDDLDKVGKTTGHHTFFEMLGNFSFGDYFKKEAIAWAWEFLTAELKLEKARLWVSIHREDDEAYRIWQDLIKVPKEKIIKLGDKENFWPSEAKAKGPNGPCGPCSEIFFDQGPNVGCRTVQCNPSCDCGRFVEVWNLVFTQFNRKQGGALEPLPKKNIDTGMGLERLLAVMQGKLNNFETDLFAPIVKEIKQGQSPSGAVPAKELVYAIADHSRSVTFAIYDGVLPSNESRGYIVRKIIRKSNLHLRGLGIKEPFLYKLVPVVASIMQGPYPELKARQEDIAQIILAEEKNFIATLKNSDTLFKENFAELLKHQDPIRAGRIAFQLYDTYGMPMELTRAWLDKHNIKISQEAYAQELEAQKSRSKSQSSMRGDVFSGRGLELDIKETKFLGYKDFSVKAKIIKIIRDSGEIKKASAADTVKIILDKTPFYPESGGQVGDTGRFIKGKNIFEVLDTQKIDKVIVHTGKVISGAFKKNDLVTAAINIERRRSIARNHTATHILQAVLRKVLGPHVQQQGSLVAEDRLRFDFTHFKDVGPEEIERIEELVNNYILDNHCLKTKLMPLAEAKKSGALAFFAEKYDPKVRVVFIGESSKELCGGTHLEATGQIGLFKIIQEGSVASGVRRIEAATGTFAYRAIKDQEQIINDAASLLNVPKDLIPKEIEKRNSRLKELEKKMSSERLGSIKSSLGALLKEAEIIKDTRVIAKEIDDLDMDLLRKNVDLLKEKAENTIIALGSRYQGRALLVLGVTNDLCQKGIDATKLIRDIAGKIGGSGGGRADFAQAGGNKPENLGSAFKQLKDIINNL